MSGAIENEITCREVVELVTDYFEGRLPLEDHRRFELHVCGCTGCRVYLAQMRAVVQVAGQLAEEVLPAGLREDLLCAFRDWKRA